MLLKAKSYAFRAQKLCFYKPKAMLLEIKNKTTFFYIYKMTREEDIRQAVQVLRQGGIILYPTDTVWGIGCDATNAEAVARIYKIKQRSETKAMICLVDSDARLQRYVRNVPDVAWDLMEYATKPTTVILDNAVNLAPNLIADDGSVAMRITREEFSREALLSLSKATGEHER